MKFTREMELFWEEIQGRPLGPGGRGPAGPTTDLTGGVGRAAKPSGSPSALSSRGLWKVKGNTGKVPKAFPSDKK